MALAILANAAKSIVAAPATPALQRFSPAPSLLQNLVRGFSDDTHDDFKPQFNQAAADVATSIKKDIDANDVMVYMKGVPEAPMCGFSNTVCRVLDAYGVDYSSRNVLADPDLREGIKKFTSWPTIPQVFVKGEFIGGCDVIMSMHQNGELEKLFADSLPGNK
eukprot:CAMPEP_0177589644 /NCGR_PEP_ID=MMETSP0419_2-20121207/6932_1 /TAXON_ID=582737 /ORGANISM="Tetraselmis sp., Strain GSL018" /LENGTH=162 /DNA_ID=CAMNT_0019080049 /DNA_START=511 /DNA_END=999 /DNA_ORIENTATION=+